MCAEKKPVPFEPRYIGDDNGLVFLFISAQPTDQGKESVLLLLLVGGFWGTDLPCTLKMGVSRENVSSKIHRKLYFKMGASSPFLLQKVICWASGSFYRNLENEL